MYTGQRNGLLPSTATPFTLSLPAYTVVDAALTYIWDRYAINLKIGNVFDKVYYESAGSLAQVRIAPGTPRNAVLSFRAHF